MLAIGALALLVASHRVPDAERMRFDRAALALDALVVFALIFLFAYEPTQPLRSLVFLVVVEAALRFGARGGFAIALLSVPLLLATELVRVERFGFEFEWESVILRVALVLLIGWVVGRLTTDVLDEARRANERSHEAERLRDALGRRVDLLEAANRCARALGSSLELGQASTAFSRELRGLVPFERMAIALGDRHSIEAVVEVGPQGRAGADAAGPLLETIPAGVLRGQPVAHGDTATADDPGVRRLAKLDLGAFLAAPLLVGARAIGTLAVARREPHSFSDEETELVSLLGRLVATAVQNTRTYEAERETTEELRRLSALRADFVSLVSHELRSPLATAIGSALTLRERWDELSPGQRTSFLDLIADETSRCAELVGDVLDTSRIESGSFGYAFSDVDLGALVRDAIASAEARRHDVSIETDVSGGLPGIRGDRDRLRQVLVNLIDNAVKYSPPQDEVVVSAYARRGEVVVDVTDRGPGIASDQHALIFEKFGRAQGGGGGKPGTGLGLFIARSIAEAHGGSLVVRSAPRQGATFRLCLPAEPWG